MHQDFKIVEFEEKYAESILKMWRISREDWNGEIFVERKEDVISEATYEKRIKVWLAIVNNEVVGYCSLEKYDFDKSALYIEILNVRSDYHGKKIGKALVLKAVRYCIENNWERLDLHTWGGNKKAVPLYKKAGFFWEKFDKGVHLMNFIPTVLNSQALKQYFNDLDWYNDRILQINLTPDGREENGFDYYEYEWKNSKYHLKVEFCRRGRGITKIETNDYIIQTRIENRELIFNNYYYILYKIENKINKPLEIEIEGTAEKNIKFNFNKKFSVKKSKQLRAKFYIKNIDYEVNEFRTLPCIISKIKINGKYVTFKTGIKPIPPIEVKVIKKFYLFFENKKNKLFLDFKNNYNKKIQATIYLKNDGIISFIKNKFELSFKPFEKKSISPEYFCKKAGIYNKRALIEILLDKQMLIYKPKLQNIITKFEDRFFKKTDRYIVMANGRYVFIVYTDEFKNNCIITDTLKNTSLTFQFLKSGKPYNEEFKDKLFDSYKIFYKNSAVVLELTFISDKFKGLKIKQIFTLYQNGMLKYQPMIINEYYDDTQIFLKTGLNLSLNNVITVYEDKLITNKAEIRNMANYWDDRKFSENWIAWQNKNSFLSILWNKNHKFIIESWLVALEAKANVKKGETKIIEPVYFFIDSFASYKSFMEFISSKFNHLRHPTDATEFVFNNGNPFVKRQFEFYIKNYLQQKFPAKVELISKKQLFNAKSQELGKEKIIQVKLDKFMPSDTVTIKMNYLNMIYQKKYQYFLYDDSQIKTFKKKNKFIVDNGILNIQADMDFAPSIFSLKFNNIEWLDTNYPNLKPNSWWNKWIGGLYSSIAYINNITLLQNEFSMDFVTAWDNMGNNWKGLLIKIDFKTEKYNGISILQYFLMLPNSNILAQKVDVINNSGQIFKKSYDFMGFFKVENKLCDTYFEHNESDDIKKIYPCDQMLVLEAKDLLSVGSDYLKEKLYIIATDFDKSFANSEMGMLFLRMHKKLFLRNGQRKSFNMFYVFDKETMKLNELRLLMNLRYEKIKTIG